MAGIAKNLACSTSQNVTKWSNFKILRECLLIQAENFSAPIPTYSDFYPHLGCYSNMLNFVLPSTLFSSLYHTQLLLEFFLIKQFIQHMQLDYFHPVTHNILYLVSVNSSLFIFMMSLWLLVFNQNVWFSFLGINIELMTYRTMTSW